MYHTLLSCSKKRVNLLLVHGSMNAGTEQLILHSIRRGLDIFLVCCLLVTAFTNIYLVIVVIDILFICFSHTLPFPNALFYYPLRVSLQVEARDNNFFSKHWSFEYQTDRIEVKDLLMRIAWFYYSIAFWVKDLRFALHSI